MEFGSQAFSQLSTDPIHLSNLQSMIISERLFSSWTYDNGSIITYQQNSHHLSLLPTRFLIAL